MTIYDNRCNNSLCMVLIQRLLAKVLKYVVRMILADKVITRVNMLLFHVQDTTGVFQLKPKVNTFTVYALI